MDKRQIKTRMAIYMAFGNLLAKRGFDSITVQEIIDEAKVGRSTFYAYFETKHLLFKEMCRELFNHVCVLDDNTDNRNSVSPTIAYQKKVLIHLMDHIKNNEFNLTGIFSGELTDHFLLYFKEFLHERFLEFFTLPKTDVPEEFMINHLIASYVEAVKWWIENGMQQEPEEIADFYMSVLDIGNPFIKN